ncbi:YagK/YfjJ domain-containing protein [Photobacterium atrarenae]|uniref:Inovirus Gp2 family protein n=1 Tax=Photobacterium atrarenae TaxID=865757 RepID=A0ABY5GGC9_9GAMM|nr:inovirus-type Gp2 protein [Photobacterium atrarenae]UTV27881.1 inovirus Gp2 family protein [Photobacterium atrarenae]
MCQIALHPSKPYLAFFPYQEGHHLIFYKKGGIIKEILNKAFGQLDAMLSHYTKVTVILLQLHQANPTQGSKPLTTMLARLKAKLQKHYGSQVGYFWVREQNKAESQHYHMAIMLNGHKCQRSKLVDIATQTYWENMHPDNFSFRVRNRIYRIRPDDNGSELRATRMRLSYMAKKEGKSQFMSYTHSFGCSRLRKKVRN